MTIEYSHQPVLPAEVTQQIGCSNGSKVVDCTIGGAGHAEAILKIISPEGLLIGIDRDDAAINVARQRLKGFSRQIFLEKANYAQIDEVLARVGVGKVDAFLFDLGVSSAQLDIVDRGFTYREDTVLDMRMDPSAPLDAFTVVNGYPKESLARVIREYGEERWASRIAEFIINKREVGPIRTTGELVQTIKEAVPAGARKGDTHPARRTFQALRIEVNDELGSLREALARCPKWLEVGGRIVVIAYHSLEDRIVKQSFRALASGCVCPPGLPVCACGKEPQLKVVTARPITPTAAEVAANPRARSAKMRVAERV